VDDDDANVEQTQAAITTDDENWLARVRDARRCAKCVNDDIDEGVASWQQS
jgi:hypothetical protein